MNRILGFTTIATVILTLSLGVILPNLGAGQPTAQAPPLAQITLINDIYLGNSTGPAPPGSDSVTIGWSSPQIGTNYECGHPQKPCSIYFQGWHSSTVLNADFTHYSSVQITLTTSKLPDICQTQTNPLTVKLEPAESVHVAITKGSLNKTSGLYECGFILSL